MTSADSVRMARVGHRVDGRRSVVRGEESNMSGDTVNKIIRVVEVLAAFAIGCWVGSW